jgi:hypothetical protein
MEVDIILLFLGAGASKPFGMPDMGVLTDIVLKKLKEKNITPSATSLIDSLIKKRIEEFKIKPDIEAVLTCVDALCNPEKGIRDAGPFATLISDQRSADKLTFGLKKSDWCKLSEEIRKIIRRTCFFPSKEYMEKLEKTYDNFLDIFNIKPGNPLNVFTTNYDLCFERYCKKKKRRLYDCFSDNGYFDYEFKEAKGWQLYKLHGSSGWIITEECEKGDFTNSYTLVEIGEETLSGKMVTDVMIYPTSEKYFSKSPYFELLNRLRDDLKNSKFGDRGPCVVIGYSFRDIPINNAFIDAFEKEDYVCIIYIDKYASTNVEKNIPELKHIIRCVDNSFEKISGLDLPLYFLNRLKEESLARPEKIDLNA